MRSPTRTFDHDATTADVLAGLELSGRRVLITGGTSGLGAETAAALASKGAEVVLSARQLDKGEAVAAAIRSSTGNEAVSVVELELGELAAVRAAAERILARHPALDVLINNAGVMACPETRTADGFELQIATNHLGPFLLTGLLVPALRRGHRSRIVNLSSRGHHIARVELQDLQFEQRRYDKWQAYGQSKTANILHAVELDRRLAGHGIRAYAVHPGAIQTELMRHLDAADLARFEQLRESGELPFKSIEAGAATQVYAATAPELDERGGVYLEDCRVAEIDDEGYRQGVRSYALDPKIAGALWSVSEELVGQRFDVDL